MAGQLTIDTLKASANVFATQNAMTGIPKAWCNYTGSTTTINGSFNVSSVTRNGTGDYTFNYTTAMPNANYATLTTTTDTPTYGSYTVVYLGSNTTSSVRVINFGSGGAAVERTCFMAILSS